MVASSDTRGQSFPFGRSGLSNIRSAHGKVSTRTALGSSTLYGVIRGEGGGVLSLTQQFSDWEPDHRTEYCTVVQCQY